MADFTQAVQKTLIHEGGYVDNPHDTGGPTKYGITQADMPGQDIAAITSAQALDYYHEHYWKQPYDEIEDQLLGEKLFDMGVLFQIVGQDDSPFAVDLQRSRLGEYQGEVVATVRILIKGTQTLHHLGQVIAAGAVNRLVLERRDQHHLIGMAMRG